MTANGIRKRHVVSMAAAGLALTLSACFGGGSGGGTEFVAAPPPAPPPPPTAQAPVVIFASPTIGEYASVGASIAALGGNLDTYKSPDARFGTISTSGPDQARVRYTPDGYYEVKLAGADWDRLVHYKGIVDPASDNNYFQPAGVPANYGYLVTRNSRKEGYSYSELGAWGSGSQGRWGYVAFGLPTPTGGVPIAGSATFKGAVSGSTDVMIADNLYGGYAPLSTDGYVTLNFNFAAGTLGGEMNLFLPDGMNPVPLGTFTFHETVFSTGSQTYSGRFDTAAPGQNFFLGQFTGPNAQETIGAWALPFVFDVNGAYVQGDGQMHQAFGAWIAKRQP